MKTGLVIRALGIAAAFAAITLVCQSELQAAKPPRHTQAPVVVVPVEPTPMAGAVIVPDSGYVNYDAPCCEHKCCKRHERKCNHSCGVPVCAPTVEYKGCPTPCGVTKVVRVSHPKTCTTIEVPVQVPIGCREKIECERDGDMELDYGKYEVTLRWRDGGRRLLVHYDN